MGSLLLFVPYLSALSRKPLPSCELWKFKHDSNHRQIVFLRILFEADTVSRLAIPLPNHTIYLILGVYLLDVNVQNCRRITTRNQLEKRARCIKATAGFHVRKCICCRGNTQQPHDIIWKFSGLSEQEYFLRQPGWTAVLKRCSLQRLADKAGNKIATHDKHLQSKRRRFHVKKRNIDVHLWASPSFCAMSSFCIRWCTYE
jgi:hypothetical protein